MITVWGRRNSVNVQKVMWTLGELGLDYERHDMAGSFGVTDEYRNLNFNELVPAIKDGNLVLWESNACVRYLARTYGQGFLWPNDPAAAIGDQWMDWATTSLGPAFFKVFLNKIRVPPDKALQEQIMAGTRDCAHLYSRLDEYLADKRFICGDDFTMGDIPLGAYLYRYFTMDIEQPELPHVEAWYRRLSARPAYQKHVMIPFGRNPDEWLEEEQRNAGIQ